MTSHQPETNPKKPSSIAIWANLVNVYIVWGSTYLTIRYAIETLPPFLMASMRFLIAGAMLYGWRRLRGDGAPSRQEWRSAAIIGTFLLVGGNGGVAWAEQRVASGLAALLVSTVPLWMILIDMLFIGRRSGRLRGNGYGWLTIIGIGIGFTGVALLIGPIRVGGHEEKVDPIGAAVLILAAFLWSIGSLYSRRATLPSSPLLGTGMEMLTGGAGLLVLGLLTGEWKQVNLDAISMRSLWGFTYLVVFGSWVGFSAYTWLLRVAPTPLVSTYAYVNPLVAILLGHLLADELLTPHTLIATALIIGSVALTTTTRSTPQEQR